tara:strand:+ start:12026 stop:12436 length:411 start_codon:yes stop_codon:yes gene_type:complete
MTQRPSWNQKNWKTILDSISSPEESDAEDELNVLQVQKNAKRVSELVHQFVPGLAEDRDHLKGNTPLGMNNAKLIREGLAASMLAQSQHSIEHHSRNAVRAADALRVNPVPVEQPPTPPPIPEASRHLEPEQGVVV